jgi:hypothetical protein
MLFSILSCWRGGSYLAGCRLQHELAVQKMRAPRNEIRESALDSIKMKSTASPPSSEAESVGLRDPSDCALKEQNLIASNAD